MDQRRVSAFSAASHRGTSSGIPTTILSLLPITSDPRSHLGAQASGPRQTPAPMRRCVIPPQSHLRAQASGPRHTPAPMRRCVIPPRSHLGAQASGPRMTPAPMCRCVIPPQNHLGARASGLRQTPAPMREHISASSSLGLPLPRKREAGEQLAHIHTANRYKRWCILDTLTADGFNNPPSSPISRKEGDPAG